jgi:hypothetical protein
MSRATVVWLRPTAQPNNPKTHPSTPSSGIEAIPISIRGAGSFPSSFGLKNFMSPSSICRPAASV